jgi:hypothetical protein
VIERNSNKLQKLKAITCTFTIAAMTSSTIFSAPVTFAASATTPKFVDVTGNFSWARSAIFSLAQQGIISGRNEMYFDPGAPITRAEFATLLVKSLGLPLTHPAKPSFRDVNAQSGSYPYIETAFQNGIVSGTGDKNNPMFSPDAPIKREDIVTMLVNALVKNKPASYDMSSLSSFKDSNQISDYAKLNVALAVKLQIINGYEDKTFRPKLTANRAVAAQIIYNQRQIQNDQINKVLAPTLKIDQTETSLHIGDTHTFTATATYSDGTKASYPISWSVSGGIGTIDQNGVFSATNAGSGSVVASIHIADGFDVTDSVKVTVVPNAPKLVLSNDTYTVVLGSTQRIACNVYDANGSQELNPSITWNLTGDIGTLDNNGVFQASKTGTGTVTVTAVLPDGTQATSTAKIIVVPKITKLSISPTTTKITQNQTQTFVCTGVDSDGNQVTLSSVKWSVTGEIGTIDTNGLFTATKVGTGTVTATYQQSDGSAPLTVSVPVQVVQPYVLKASSNVTTYYPGQNIPITIQALDDTNQVATNDSGHSITLTVTMPDGGTYTRTATDQNGVANITLSHTLAGTYTVVASANGFTTSAPFTFQVVPGDAVSLDVFATPSPWVMPANQVSLKAIAKDTWGNPIPYLQVPVQYSSDHSNYGTFVTKNGTTGDSAVVATFTAGNTKGDLNISVTANYQGHPLSGTTTLHVYTDHAAGLVSGKGVWMTEQWDWKTDAQNNSVASRLQSFKQAGVKHIYLEVSDTNRGFYGKDALEDMLHQAHSMGFSVIGWIYSTLDDPVADGKLAADVANYVTKSGDRLDGIGADIEESANMSDSNVTTFAQTFRSSVSNGNDYPLIAVTYPATWRPNYPWKAIGENFDVVAPMDYWHYKAKAYSYDEVYNTVYSEIAAIRKATGNPYMAVTMVGQAYNMFDDPNQYPTGTEVQAAMQAAKDSGCVGYSCYRGPFTSTQAEWNAFASFSW